VADTLVIIVTYNASVWLERCLGSVAVSSHKADAIIIDNCSTDGSPEAIESGWPQFKLVRNSGNLGFGAANNIGFKYALDNGYKYVYLLNQDAWLEKDTLELLIPALKDGIGILSPLQKDAAGKLDKNFEKKCGKYLRRAGAGAASAEQVEVPFVMAAHWLLPIEAVRMVGGFSPVFKQYGEDDNYIDRLDYHGLKCAVLPTAAAVHDRASRNLPKAAKMKLKTVSSLVRVSDPARSFRPAFLWEIVWLVGMGIKNFSVQPWKYISVLFSRRSELKFCSEQSKEAGAFLPR